ncbi:MAG: signal peptidase I [Clostridia bacterium]|nr:signal peptidase I [Clostridia bacterium]
MAKTKKTKPETAAETAVAEGVKEEKKGLGLWFDIVSILLVASIIIAVFFTFFFRFSSVVGISMESTLHDGDWVVLTQMKDKPEYGDIVVISQPNTFNENIIKRVIATEGQTVDIDFTTGTVTVDGKVLDEPYINNATINQYDLTFPRTVPKGYCFCMGDNRQNSLDCRSSEVAPSDDPAKVGFIRNEYILGEAVLARTSNGFENMRFQG